MLLVGLATRRGDPGQGGGYAVGLSHRDLWRMYALVATAGSVLGAYLTFRLARKAALARRFVG